MKMPSHFNCYIYDFEHHYSSNSNNSHETLRTIDNEHLTDDFKRSQKKNTEQKYTIKNFV